MRVIQVALVVFVSSFIGILLINLCVMFSLNDFLTEENLNSSIQDAIQSIRMEYNIKRSQLLDKRAKSLSLSNTRDSVNKSDVESEDALDFIPPFFAKYATPGYTLGKGRTDKVSIMIGVRAVKHFQKAAYLHAAIHSLLTNLYPADEDRVGIVIFLAETDENYVSSVSSTVHTLFTRAVNNGLVQVISAPTLMYNEVNKLPQTGTDHSKKLPSNAKEVFDAAYLMFYCHNRTDYYVMIEEDTITVKGYVKAMEHFARFYESQSYFFLSLSSWNAVGKMFRSSDIPKWISHLFTFYGDKQLKWLLNDYVHVKACVPGLTEIQCKAKEEILMPERFPGLFYQTGGTAKRSEKKWIEREYLINTRQVSWNDYRNPSARITHSLRAVDNLSSAESWYNDAGGMNERFYVQQNHADDHVTIDFENPVNISKVLVKTGMHEGKEKIRDRHAVVEYILPRNGKKSPISYKTCAYFDNNGEAECHVDAKFVAGLRIQFYHNQSNRIRFDLIYVK